MKRVLALAAMLFGLVVPPAGSALADGHNSLTVYSYLTPYFIQPVLDAFELETGIAVEAEYMTAGQLLDRLTAERADPNADVILTMEALRLAKLVEADVLAPVQSSVLENAIPAKYRHPDGLWFGMSKWARTVFYSKYRVNPDDLETYADLTDKQWRGKVCVRTSNKIYVQSLLASLIANEGEKKTRAYAEGLVKNFAREPIDLDQAQLQAVADGICDVAVANTYYYARLMRQGVEGNAARILDSVGVKFLEQEGRGVHMNISGFAMVKGTDNSDTALKLMEYLVRPMAQRLYADPSKDHPVLKGLKPEMMLATLGSFKEDDLPIHELSQHYELAEQISRDAGWLWK